MSLEDKKEDYSWKDEARAIVAEQLDKRLNGEINYNPIVSIESAVGTGKTSEVASNYADLILRLKDRKTFHAFVAPRILLAKQQCAAVQKYLDDEPGLKQEGIKVICKVYCSESSSDVSKEFPKEGEEHLSPNDKHIIYFYCDDSLWRDDENCQCSKRFEALLKNNVEFDRVNGIIYYDEAHNYDTQRQLEMMYGKENLEKANSLYRDIITESEVENY